jgi:hypothetical protein
VKRLRGAPQFASTTSDSRRLSPMSISDGAEEQLNVTRRFQRNFLHDVSTNDRLFDKPPAGCHAASVCF